MRILLLLAGIALMLGLPEATVSSVLGAAAKGYVLWTVYVVTLGLAVVAITRRIERWRARPWRLKALPPQDGQGRTDRSSTTPQ